MGRILLPFGCEDLKSALSCVDRTEGGYVLGGNSFWHGGIHLTTKDDTQAIVAPDDGEIVAHRIMTKRSKGKMSFGIDSEGNKISSDKDEDFDSSFSFVLTRHQFITPNDQEIVYYLLHMHLLCYENYQDFHKLRPPVYLSRDVRYFVKKEEDEGGSLVGIGLNLRSSIDGMNNVLTVVKAGEEFEFKRSEEYGHQSKASYMNVILKEPITFNVNEAVIQTGLDKTCSLRIIPDDEWCKKNGLWYPAVVANSEQIDRGVPLYVNGTYIGDLIVGQWVHVKEYPDRERVYRTMLDDIMFVKLTEINTARVNEVLYNAGFRDRDSISKSDVGKVIDIDRALRIAGFGERSNSLYATIHARPHDVSGIWGAIQYIERKYSKFIVNTRESNECGLAAYDKTSSGVRLIDIPHSQAIELLWPVAIYEIKSGNFYPIKPLRVTQPTEGYLYCSKNHIDRQINEVNGEFDRIKVYAESTPIQRGDIIGYPGSHKKHNMVHMELWLENLEFIGNAKNDVKLEDKAILPQGTSVKVQETRVIQSEARAHAVEKDASIEWIDYVLDSRGEKTIGKVNVDNEKCFIYLEDLENVSSFGENRQDVLIFTETCTVNIFSLHPEECIEEVTYTDSVLDAEIQLDSMPRTVHIDGHDYYPIRKVEKVDGSGEYDIHLVLAEYVDKRRLNFYDWERFFKVSTAEDLAIKASGYVESKADIEKAVLEEYNELLSRKEMVSPPSYLQSHPLSHLIVESGTEWSANHQATSGWLDDVVDHMWDEQNVSSHEEGVGIIKSSMQTIFKATIQLYLNEISFYDRVKSNSVVAELPDSSSIFHAHPLRFIDHINNISVSRPPWLEVAVEQFVKYKGLVQKQSPLKEQVNEYFSDSSSKSLKYSNPYCSVFVNWCFNQAGGKYRGTNLKANVKAYDWLPPPIAKQVSWCNEAKKSLADGWISGELIEDIRDVFVGAIIVFEFSHVAFVVGQTRDGNSLVYLGGGQTDDTPGNAEGNRSICTNWINKRKLVSKHKFDRKSKKRRFLLVKPVAYTVSSFDRDLPIIDPDGDELDFDTSR